MLRTKTKIKVEVTVEYGLTPPEPGTGYPGDIDIYDMYIDNERLSQDIVSEIEQENHFIIINKRDKPEIGVLDLLT